MHSPPEKRTTTNASEPRDSITSPCACLEQRNKTVDATNTTFAARERSSRPRLQTAPLVSHLDARTSCSAPGPSALSPVSSSTAGGPLGSSPAPSLPGAPPLGRLCGSCRRGRLRSWTWESATSGCLSLCRSLCRLPRPNPPRSCGCAAGLPPRAGSVRCGFRGAGLGLSASAGAWGAPGEGWTPSLLGHSARLHLTIRNTETTRVSFPEKASRSTACHQIARIRCTGKSPREVRKHVSICTTRRVLHAFEVVFSMHKNQLRAVLRRAWCYDSWGEGATVPSLMCSSHLMSLPSTSQACTGCGAGRWSLHTLLVALSCSWSF